MTPELFISLYILSGLAAGVVGYIIGRAKAETEAEKFRRWWFNREARNNGSRFRG